MKPKNNKLTIYLRLHIMLIKALHNDKAGKNRRIMETVLTLIKADVEDSRSHNFPRDYNN